MVLCDSIQMQKHKRLYNPQGLYINPISSSIFLSANVWIFPVAPRRLRAKTSRLGQRLRTPQRRAPKVASVQEDVAEVAGANHPQRRRCGRGRAEVHMHRFPWFSVLCLGMPQYAEDSRLLNL